jgi:uncharacterized damage-inducible protein DinB
MTATQFFVYLVNREVDSFLRMVAKVPEDKLDWTPHPSLRSARDQFQEVATILEHTWSVFTDRKLGWDLESFLDYKKHRKTFHTREELEAELRRQTDGLIKFAETLSEDDLDAPVEMPWPGPHNLADGLHYHLWNLSYHEGQIASLLMQLDIDPMG